MNEKNLSLTLLFDFYGDLLSEVQQNIFDLSYNEDLSLSEIAQQTDMTRQGVRDALKKSEELLLKYEDKLGLRAKFLKIEDDIGKTCQELQKLYRHTDADGQKLIDTVIKDLSEIDI